MSSGFNRREFSKAAVTAATAGAVLGLAPARVLGANDQVRLGFIGVGNRGCQLSKGFLAHPDAKIVALCDVYEPYLNADYDRLDPRFAGLGKRIRPDAEARGRRRARQGLPRRPRSQGHRRRRDRHARPLARHPDDRRLQGRQGRLRREAAVDDDRRGPGDGRGGAQARPDRPGRHASPFVADVRAARRGGSIRARSARSPWRAPRSPATWRPAGSAMRPESAPAGRPRLGPLAGPAAGAAVPGDDHAVQVPLVAALLVADGQLGRPLLRPDPLADRRARAGESVSAHGGRFAVDDDRTIPDTSEAIFEHASGMLTRLQHLRGQRPAGPGPRCRGRAAGHARDGLRQRSAATRSSPSAAVRSRIPSPGARARSSRRPTATSTSRPPATSSTTSRAASGPTPTSRRAIARPPSPTWRTSRWPPGNASSGTPRPSASPTATRPTALALRVSQALDPGLIGRGYGHDNDPLRLGFSSPPIFCATPAHRGSA